MKRIAAILAAALLCGALLSSCSKPAEEPHGWQPTGWPGERKWVPPLGDNDGGIHR